MIICLPGELPAEALTASPLDQRFGVAGTMQTRFWARTRLRRREHSQLIAARPGRPVRCAGGPAGLLDLTGLRQAAGVGAGIRHQLWQQVVHGTRAAQPWPVYLARHLSDPGKYPHPRAVTDFRNQPRVNAMRMHNAATPGAGQLLLQELEMFQAGPLAYQHYSAATAVCGDAMLLEDGRRLSPASDALADRVTYLHLAGRHLDTTEPGRRLLAVTL